MPMWKNIYLQNSNSPLMEHLLFFHEHSMLLITTITIMTFTMLMKSLIMKNFNRFMLELHEMELFWTSLPAFMLMFIAMPSLKTLYMMEENMNPLLTIKTMGFQWHWSYEYSNFIDKKFLSMIYSSDKMRLQTTSNNLVIPSMSPIRMLITSKDVLHSWTIPSLGMKTDATPGRMNQITIMTKRPSILMGQCSEICGAGHSFMPIMMETINTKNFISLLK